MARILMSVQLNEELYDKLREASEILDIPRSVLIRWAIRDYCETIIEGGTIDNGEETSEPVTSRDNPC